MPTRSIAQRVTRALRRAKSANASSLRKVLFATSLALLLLGGALYLLHALTGQVAAGFMRNEQQQGMTEALGALTVGLRDVERAEMTYLLTGEEASWKQFESAAALISREYESLRSASAGYAKLNESLSAIEPQLGSELSRM